MGIKFQLLQFLKRASRQLPKPPDGLPAVQQDNFSKNRPFSIIKQGLNHQQKSVSCSCFLLLFMIVLCDASLASDHPHRRTLDVGPMSRLVHGTESRRIKKMLRGA
jgi:hypothetical protein